MVKLQLSEFLERLVPFMLKVNMTGVRVLKTLKDCKNMSNVLLTYSDSKDCLSIFFSFRLSGQSDSIPCLLKDCIH